MCQQQLFNDFTATEPTSGYNNPILFALSTTEAVVLPYRPQDLTSGGAAGARTALDVFSKAETDKQVYPFAIEHWGKNITNNASLSELEQLIYQSCL